MIGTGASAIQFVPQIQPRVKHLTLFQRTPPWIMPRNDHAISPQRRARFRRYPILQQLVRGGIYLQREIGALALVYRPQLTRSTARMAREHLATQVADPELRAKLTPHYTMGCKRILLSDDFYPAVSRPNVEVVTERVREVLRRRRCDGRRLRASGRYDHLGHRLPRHRYAQRRLIYAGARRAH